MNEKGIEITLNTEIVDSITVNGISYLVSSTGEQFEFDETIWCVQAIGQSWIRDTGLDVTEDGFICVQVLSNMKILQVFHCLIIL